MNSLNLLLITTNTPVSRTSSSLTEPSLKDSIPNLWRMCWSITETESFKLFFKKIFSMRTLIWSETYPTLTVKKPALQSFSQVSSPLKKRKLKNLETDLKSSGKGTNTSSKLSKSIKNLKMFSRKHFWRFLLLLKNTTENTSSSHSARLWKKVWEPSLTKETETKTKEQFTLTLKKQTSMTEISKSDWNNLRSQLNLDCGKNPSKSWRISTVWWESERVLWSQTSDTNILKTYQFCSRSQITGIIMLLLFTISS